MENFIRNLKISNFKSIREAELECGRVNLFVGKPNVGKSNVLEAISLLNQDNTESLHYLENFARYDHVNNLIHFGSVDKYVHVETEGNEAFLDYNFEQSQFRFLYKQKINGKFELTGQVLTTLNGQVLDKFGFGFEKILKYEFKGSVKISAQGFGKLIPPHGLNLFSVLESNSRLKEIIPDLFKEYGLEFVIDISSRTFEIQRKQNGIVYKIPYTLIADTLQRLIFYYAAIYSNKDSIILFEEPEAHSFPPYVRELALKISESTDNQYFITTHSPHLFTTLVEETPVVELAVFITYFENYETKFKKLSADEISELLNYGIDIFFNQRWFLNEESAQNPA